MSEKPILFSGEMIQAILDGRKTQTRRVINPQPFAYSIIEKQSSGYFLIYDTMTQRETGLQCPYEPGSLLWVRETWMVGNYSDCSFCGSLTISYRARGQKTIGADLLPSRACVLAKRYGFQSVQWKPSIFMPRWACRLRLEVTDVRVERVQDISIDDAIAEGINLDGLPPERAYCDDEILVRFADLWDKINAKRGYGWDTDPWVWVIQFERLTSETN